MSTGDIRSVEAILQQWRQGDCVRGDGFSFFYVTAPEDDDDSGIREDDRIHGFVVATQTCDVVRSPEALPYVEVCPLIKTGGSVIGEVKALRRPGFLYIPSLESDLLIADLNRTMTVEKKVVAGWDRVSGCKTDQEQRLLQWALARKRKRFAFPDDFNQQVSNLLKRFRSKHDKQSPEGLFMRDLAEIRVQASPSWEAPKVDLFLWFVKNFDVTNMNGLAANVKSWVSLFEVSERFVSVEHCVASYEDMTARDYISSDVLDLDYLSTR